MEAEKETLEKIKLFLSCNNDSAARRAIEQYGHYRHEQALQLQQAGVNGSFCSNCRWLNSCAIRIDYNVDTCEEHEF